MKAWLIELALRMAVAIYLIHATFGSRSFLTDHEKVVAFLALLWFWLFSAWK